MTTDANKKVRVIGGGYSGLTAAYYLTRAGYQVTVYEKQSRLGGLLGSYKNSHGITEQAANAFLANAELEEISREIGVPLQQKKKVAKKRYIFRWARPRRLPLGPLSFLRLIWFIFRYIFARTTLKPKAGESLANWGYRHLGQEATQYLLGPAMQGIYSAQPEELSASLVLQFLFKKTGAKGKLRGSVAPEKGMQEWLDGLTDYLQKHGCKILQGIEVEVQSASVPTVLATDLDAAKELLAETPYFQSLQQAQSRDITSVTMQWDKSSPELPAGFGCLFPGVENFNSLGVLYNNHIFAGRASETISETWIFSQTQDGGPEAANKYFSQRIIEDRRRMTGGEAQAIAGKVFQWPKALPLYDNTLEKILIDLPTEEGNIFLMGNYLGQIGLSKMIFRAKELPEKINERGQWLNMASS